MTFYSRLAGIVGLVECHSSYFVAIFALVGWSLQLVRVKQLILCGGKVLKAMRFHHCI